MGVVSQRVCGSPNTSWVELLNITNLMFDLPTLNVGKVEFQRPNVDSPSATNSTKDHICRPTLTQPHLGIQPRDHLREPTNNQINQPYAKRKTKHKNRTTKKYFKYNLKLLIQSILPIIFYSNLILKCLSYTSRRRTTSQFAVVQEDMLLVSTWQNQKT